MKERTKFCVRGWGWGWRWDGSQLFGWGTPRCQELEVSSPRQFRSSREQSFIYLRSRSPVGNRALGPPCLEGRPSSLSWFSVNSTLCLVSQEHLWLKLNPSTEEQPVSSPGEQQRVKWGPQESSCSFHLTYSLDQANSE